MYKKPNAVVRKVPLKVLCDFDRASSLMCGNKMPTRRNRGFYCRSYCLFNMFRAPLCPSSGAQEYYTVVAACSISCCGFSSSWSGVELRVMCPVCRMLQRSYFFVLCFIKTQPFVKRKPVTTEKKNTGTITFRFRQVLLYYLFQNRKPSFIHEPFPKSPRPYQPL